MTDSSEALKTTKMSTKNNGKFFFILFVILMVNFDKTTIQR